MLVKKDAVVITNEKEADRVTEVMKVEEVLAEDAWEEDVKADDVCVEDVMAEDVCAEGMMVESVKAESVIKVAQDEEEVNQEDEGDITDAASEDCEEITAHGECMLKVSILAINVWWWLCSRKASSKYCLSPKKALVSVSIIKGMPNAPNTTLLRHVYGGLPALFTREIFPLLEQFVAHSFMVVLPYWKEFKYSLHSKLLPFPSELLSLT